MQLEADSIFLLLEEGTLPYSSATSQVWQMIVFWCPRLLRVADGCGKRN
jgi:hypothetical protein